MVKSLAALAIFALGTSAIVLPYVSQVEAGETIALAKGDRLDNRPDCSQQVWPHISSSCLRGGPTISGVRLVTSERH